MGRVENFPTPSPPGAPLSVDTAGELKTPSRGGGVTQNFRHGLTYFQNGGGGRAVPKCFQSNSSVGSPGLQKAQKPGPAGEGGFAQSCLILLTVGIRGYRRLGPWYLLHPRPTLLVLIPTPARTSSALITKSQSPPGISCGTPVEQTVL
jgi:hypothetical protein